MEEAKAVRKKEDHLGMAIKLWEKSGLIEKR
jgi:hypothetical protein